MSSTESEDDVKQRPDRRPDPLCLFCQPTDCPCEEEPYISKRTQCNRGSGDSWKGRRKKRLAAKLKQEMWLRRRTEVSLKRRRRMMEAGKHLKTYLLLSVRPGGEQERVYVPCLIEALETLKDAWPPNKRQSIDRYLDDGEPPKKDQSNKNIAMIKEKSQNQVPFTRVSRRPSMPEEFMRKYFLKNGITSDESETNQTFPDAGSASSKNSGEKTRKDVEESHPSWEHEVKSGKNDGRIKRVTQNDYDKQGKGIIKQKTKEKGLQTGRSTAPSEDTEDNRTSESLPSSSPVELRRQTSTSGNQSSESEEVKCTCAELTSSKDTSTDLFRSGNSTLSQTVSEKSTSTQDSTISIHSVSTGGSTVTAESNSTSPDYFGKTSAKESTSPERTPRVVLFRGRRSICGFHRRKYPKFVRKRPHCRRRHRGKARRENSRSKKETSEERNAEEEKEQKDGEEKPTEKYKWAKYTEEEMYMMQQMRHKKFIENNRRFSIPLPATPDTGSIDACAASGSAYKHIDELEERILIPRYSALPRTLSMLVNTSSGDTVNSDSDSLSLADSLEDFPVVHVHHISHDTKKERKPVRGDVNALPETKNKKKKKHPRPRAFFVSMKDPYGEDELASGIAKLPEPPERIKERINERQLNILNLRRKNMERRREEMKDKKRQRRNARERRYTKDRKEFPVKREKREDSEKCRHFMKHSDKKFEQEDAKATQGETNCNRRKKTRKEGVTQTEAGCRSQRGNGRTEKPQATDNTKKDGETQNVGKPQAVIHPSMPASENEQSRRNKQAVSQSRPWRYRQKFEVIPEEKSSSVSSTDETKTGRRASLAKPSPPQTIPGKPELSRRYSLESVSNIVFAKFMEKSLHGMSTGNQPIILVSPKSPHSRKGRDALIAMNRGDFNRLSKGWMNFYMLKETSDGSEDSLPEERDERTQSRDKGRLSCGKEKTSEFNVKERSEGGDLKCERDVASDRDIVEHTTSLNEGIRFHSSNTILRQGNEDKLSLPELKVPFSGGRSEEQRSTHKNSPLILPKVPHVASECDGMDSDSTVYCQPPSLIVPRLAFDGSGDFPSEGSLSETNSESGEPESKTKFPLKQLPLRKRGLCPRPRLRRDGHHDQTKRGSQGYPGWSVTVAGSLELSNGTPDLEMRLSFPANGCGPPQASQSDSGFADDGSQNVETSERTLERELITSDGSVKHRWTVTVKNPKQGDADGAKRRADKGHALPNIGQSQSRNVKKVLKNGTTGGECHRKISIFWPKVELSGGEWAEEGINDEELSVRGNAISMEKKPRPQTMTERDLTRGLTARSSLSDAKSLRK